MYQRSAPYYDLIYEFKDYQAASAEIEAVIRRHRPEAATLLDVACGTGRHAEYLGATYEVEGLDLNPELLEAARRRCPGAIFHVGDMRDFQLEKTYDVVACFFSSIAYAKTHEGLRATMKAMAEHVAPRGLLLVEPWFSRDNFWTGTITANVVDRPETKIVWMYTSDEPHDDLAVLNMHFLVGTPEGVEHFEERHELGLFSDAQYREAFEEHGFTVEHDANGPFGRGLYIGSR